LVSGSDLMIVRCACSGVDNGPNSVRVSFDQGSRAVCTVENKARVDGVVCLFMYGLGWSCAVVSSSAETTMTRKPHWGRHRQRVAVGELTVGQQQQPAANRLLRTGVPSPCSAPLFGRCRNPAHPIFCIPSLIELSMSCKGSSWSLEPRNAIPISKMQYRLTHFHAS
jgi:hypothetical protein